MKTQENFWNGYLTRVPHPKIFDFRYIDAKEITPEYTQQMYYIAWIFLAQDILPKNPECGYPYPQIACGKPSMWAYGDPKAIYTASWESFFGMMALGYVMPETAWDAYLGLMSLVDEDGMLAGESLPSEKAHTAILLYRITGDKEKLSSVYDKVARYLRWRVENPRWIYLEHNDPEAADADFAESALLDIAYMIEIASIVERENDIPMWQKMYDEFLEKYRQWFFDEKGNTYQYCNKIRFSRSRGNTIWVTKGLGIDGIGKEYIEMLYKRFHEEYDPAKPFCGFPFTKYPDNSHTINGLVKCGYISEARIMTESCARDVLSVGMFAEGYSPTEPPLPDGVRPSIFGCVMLIDSILLANGFRLTENKKTDYME